MQEGNNIYTAPLQELWAILQEVMVQENDIHPKELSQIKYGIYINIPIQWLSNNWFYTYPHTKKAYVRGYGKYFIEELMMEIETRESMIRNIILRNQDEGPTISRSG